MIRVANSRMFTKLRVCQVPWVLHQTRERMIRSLVQLVRRVERVRADVAFARGKIGRTTECLADVE